MGTSPLPSPATGNVIRLTVETLTNGQRCQNTFDYGDSTGAPISASALLAFIGDAETRWKTQYLAVLSPLSTLTSITASEMHYGVTPSQVSILAPGTVGTAGATNLPLETGATMSRYGSIKGKHGRGRVTLPAVPNTFTTPATDANILNATAITAYNALGAALTGTIVSGGVTFVPVISVRPVPPGVLVLYTAGIATYILRNTLGSARRRKPGRGI